jgi:hypothetical protein
MTVTRDGMEWLRKEKERSPFFLNDFDLLNLAQSLALKKTGSLS